MLLTALHRPSLSILLCVWLFSILFRAFLCIYIDFYPASVSLSRSSNSDSFFHFRFMHKIDLIVRLYTVLLLRRHWRRRHCCWVLLLLAAPLVLPAFVHVLSLIHTHFFVLHYICYYSHTLPLLKVYCRETFMAKHECAEDVRVPLPPPCNNNKHKQYNSNN